jgi:hypothetical protein
MPLYLTLSRGSRADNTRPILAISDQRFIRRVLSEVASLANDECRDERRDEAGESRNRREQTHNVWQ